MTVIPYTTTPTPPRQDYRAAAVSQLLDALREALGARTIADLLPRPVPPASPEDVAVAIIFRGMEDVAVWRRGRFWYVQRLADPSGPWYYPPIPLDTRGIPPHQLRRALLATIAEAVAEREIWRADAGDDYQSR